MNNSMISAMVSMNGIQQRLDLLSDNIANMDTTGYKRKEASFEDTLTRVQKQTSKMELTGRATPSGFDLGFGSRMTSITSNFTQGSIKLTDNPTDLAIEGNALFAVLTESGKAYTRAGDFHLQQDPSDPESTYLVNNMGQFVLNADDERIAVPAGSKLQIDGQGNIRAVSGNEVNDLGRIQLLTPIRPEALEQVDGNLFVLASGAVEADVLSETALLPQAQQAQIRQGALEGSNVNLTDEMAEMLQVQRAYQLAARALSSSETMMGLANNLRG
ncbi:MULTISPECIES: flagellar hook-basal body protein [Paenibacillus]|uniref:Flagellar basal-body rod protein FlgG n=1 Tax=Paenibacillus vini TaxID=1476024 RepID=A0ABQ4M6F0_9BACL|nr:MULTISPECIES: flagellar hook-basal body protein [Paenibacillus]MBQ4900050.1 flagellar hook-basal body protein [Paenibacillus sp. Marseille-P2973]GIP51571.1 flagellar basal-body rod protein FlgG [Paenibacillus vini]